MSLFPASGYGRLGLLLILQMVLLWPVVVVGDPVVQRAEPSRAYGWIREGAGEEAAS